jgi:hypothetical protein
MLFFLLLGIGLFLFYKYFVQVRAHGFVRTSLGLSESSRCSTSAMCARQW